MNEYPLDSILRRHLIDMFPLLKWCGEKLGTTWRIAANEAEWPQEWIDFLSELELMGVK